MAKINLMKGESKGVKVNLSKESGGSTKFRMELSWDMAFGGPNLDLDVMAVLCDGAGKVADDDARNLIFFNNTERASACGAVTISEDNKTGEGDGADEWLEFDFSKINPGVEKIDMAIAIYDPKPGQNFGMVENAKAVIKDMDKSTDLVEYWLDDAGTATAIIMGQFMKRGTEWSFKVLEAPTNEGLSAVLGRYGLDG